MKLLKHYVTHCLYSFHISHFMCACSSITFCLCLHQNFIDVSPFFSFVQQIEPTKTNWVSKSCIWGPKLDLMGPFGPWIGTWRGQNQVLGVSHDRLNWYQSIFHFCTATWVHPGSVCPKKLSFKEKVTFFRITPPSTPISKTQFDYFSWKTNIYLPWKLRQIQANENWTLHNTFFEPFSQLCEHLEQKRVTEMVPDLLSHLVLHLCIHGIN